MTLNVLSRGVPWKMYIMSNPSVSTSVFQLIIFFRLVNILKERHCCIIHLGHIESTLCIVNPPPPPPISISQQVRRKISLTTALLNPGACFSKAPETFRARKAMFSWSFSKNREVYKPETFFMKRTSVHFRNMGITQLYKHKIWDFATAFRVRKLFGTLKSGPLGL